MKKIAFLLIAALGLSGCFKYKYTLRSAAPSTAPNPGKMHSNFVFGFIESNPTDLAAECPGGFAQVEHQWTPMDAVLGYCLGAYEIWIPSHVTVTCATNAAPPAAPPPPPPSN